MSSKRIRSRHAASGIVGALLMVLSTAGPARATVDTTFGGDGIVTTPIGSGAYPNAVAIQSDGKIIAVGERYTVADSEDSDFALARYNTDGSLDTSFDTDGIATASFGSVRDKANSVAIQSDGKIIMAGQSYTAADSDDSVFALARYNTDGSLDMSFATDGIVTTSFDFHAFATAVAIQSDGKIVAVGGVGPAAGVVFALARYNTVGSLDTSFGTDGIMTTPIGDSAGADSVAIQSDGKIVVAGFSDSNFALARYNTVGSLDTSFGTDGIKTTPIGSRAGARAVAIQSDGKIVAAGASFSTAGYGFALARYNPHGSLDTSFDTDGIKTTPIGDSAGADSVAIQSDGKIVAAGSSDSGFALARYNTVGSLDTSFGTDGIATTRINQYSQATAVAIQSDGKIVAVGRSYGAAFDSVFALARYNIDGSLDGGPVVTSRNPVTNASITGNFTVTFSTPVVGVSTSTFSMKIAGTTTAVAGTVTPSAATETSTATFDPSGTLVPGQSYTLSLASGITDLAGNPLTPFTWTARTALTVDQASVAVKEWWDRDDSGSAGGGSYHSSRTSGTRAKFTFTGTDVSLRGLRASNGGYGDIYLDGVKVATKSWYAASAGFAAIYSRTGLSNASHSVEVRVLGTKPAASSGAWVYIDAWKVGPISYQENSPKVTERFVRSSSSPASGGTYDSMLHSTTGDNGARPYLSLVFKGVGVAYYARVGPGYGKATIYIDGVNMGTVDLYAASTSYKLKFSTTSLSNALHTLRIDVNGTKRAASSGSAVTFDRFVIR